MSGGEPGLSLDRATRLSPAMNLETAFGTFPDAKRFTIPVREKQIGVSKVASAAVFEIKTS